MPEVACYGCGKSQGIFSHRGKVYCISCFVGIKTKGYHDPEMRCKSSGVENYVGALKRASGNRRGKE